MSGRITLRRGSGVTLPHDFGPAFDRAGWTFTCDLKQCLVPKHVPPQESLAIASLSVVDIADTGLGRVGVAVVITGAVSATLESGGFPYVLDIRGTKFGHEPYQSSPVFVAIADVVTL